MYCGIEIIEINVIDNIRSHLAKHDDFLFSHKNLSIPNPISPWPIVINCGAASAALHNSQ